MLGKTICISIATLFLIACAEAQYAKPQSTTTDKRFETIMDTCQAKFNSNHCVSLVWDKMPTGDDSGSFLFKIFQADESTGTTSEVDLDGTVQVILWMPSMGHGSSPVTVERIGTGTYRATNVFFVMRGEWEVRIQLKVNNEIKDQAIIFNTL